MQPFIDVINHLLGKSWFPAVGTALMVALFIVWAMFSETEKFLRWQIKMQPKNFDAYLKLGHILAEDDECYEEAEALFRKAIVLNPRNRQGYYQLFLLQANAERMGEVERTVSELMERFPNDPIAYAWKGRILAEKDSLKAEEFFRQAIAMAPRFLFARENYGYLLLKQKRFIEAEKEFIAALDDAPTSSWTYRNLIYVLFKLKKYREAEIYSRKFIKTYPHDPAAYHDLATALSDLGKYPESEKAYKLSLAKKPDYAEVYRDFGLLLHTKLKKYDDAEKQYRKAIESNGSYLEAYNALAILLTDLKRYEEAERVYQQAIEILPSDSGTCCNLGNLLSCLERYNEAEEAYRKAIKSDPSHANSYYNFGILLQENLNRPHEAEAAYRKAIELDPSYAHAYNNLGNLLKTLKRPNEAEIAYIKTIELDPSPLSYGNLASFLRDYGREQDALGILQQAIEENASDFYIFLEIASLYRSFGDVLKAQKHAEYSRSLLPDGKAYWYNLTCIESILGNVDIAFANLQKASKESSFDKKWAWEDRDLEWIRDDPRFVEIVGPKSANKNSETS